MPVKQSTRVALMRRTLRRAKPNTGHHGPILSSVLGIGCLGLILIMILPIVTAAGAAAAVYSYFAQDLPESGAITQEAAAFETTKIYGRPVKDPITGKEAAPLLYEIFDPQGGKRTRVSIDVLKRQRYVMEATISLEDKDFYTNPGIDFRGIVRAAYLTLSGQDSQGASTITQQLVRNVLLTQKFTWERKAKEIILALEVSRKYTKDQILEMYLNEIHYGNLAYGIEAAAQSYFGKHAQDLSLAESAMLATLPRSPGANSPITNPAEAKRQQEIALDVMVREGYISAEDAYAAKQEKLNLITQRFDIQAPHFVFYVRDQLEDLLVHKLSITPEQAQAMIYKGGLTVYTTLDMNLQRTAEKLLDPATPFMTKLREENNANNASLVSIRPTTGEILTMVGSVDYFNNAIDGQVNMATSERQPGSSFKPFAYVTAFQKGWTPATLVMDVRTSFDDYPNPPYIPENVDRTYKGPVLIRQALANSMNIPAVRVTQFAGVNDILATAHRMGITTLTREGYYGLSLTLGGGEVKLLDMVFAYTGFANLGELFGEPVPAAQQKAGFREVNPVSILRVDSAEGKPIYEYNYPQSSRVLPAEYAYLITDILSDNAARVAIFGPNSPLQLDRPAAAKTGTTNDWHDNWTIGYTPDLVTGVWVGNADNQEMKRSFGSTAAAPLWHDFMIEALKNVAKSKFAEPPGLERAEICALSGLKPTDLCQNRRTEVFIKGTAPKQPDDMHQVFRIDRVTGQLATQYTPPDQVEEKVFEVYPPEAADWVRDNKVPQPPTEYSDRSGPGSVADDVAVVSPNAYAYVGGKVTVTGNARSGNFRAYRLEFGAGLQPSAVQQIGPDHFNQVSNGPLEVWDTGALAGVQTLQLSVIESTGNVRQVRIPVVVDNVTPTIKLGYPNENDVFIAIKEGDNDKLRIQAEATDNAAMGHVEFFLDGKPLGLTSVAPYNVLWPISLSGVITTSHIITATAVDAAGNRADSAPVKIWVAPEPPKKTGQTETAPAAWSVGPLSPAIWREEGNLWIDKQRERAIFTAIAWA